MAVLSDYTSGTITLANGSTAVTGTGTLFDVAKFREGDTLQIENLTAVIASVNSNTSLTLTAPWTGTTLTNAIYRARYLPDGARVTAQATTLIELLGNGVLSNLAELGVEDGKVPVGNAAGEYELKPVPTDPNGTLAKLAALADVGTLGLTLLPLASGTSAQYIQGDGSLQEKADLPVSTSTQTALNGKFNTSGGTVTGRIVAPGLTSVGTSGASAAIIMHAFGTGDTRRGELYAELSGTANVVIRAVNPPSSQDVFFVFRSNGSASIPGALSKGSGTFLTDHPKDPFNKNLRHGFVESTEYVNLYRGMVDLVDGRMTVDIDAAFGMTDGTFEALNADVMVSSLQNQYGPDRVWVEGPADNGKFTIVCEDAESTATIAWMVTGRRNDAFVRSDLDPNTDSEGRFIPEFEKEDA